MVYFKAVRYDAGPVRGSAKRGFPPGHPPNMYDRMPGLIFLLFCRQINIHDIMHSYRSLLQSNIFTAARIQ